MSRGASHAATSGRKKPKKPALVTPKSPSVSFWSCRQISYGLSPEDLTEGMRVGFCEHAMKEFPAGKVPKASRFILATVHLSGPPEDPLMTLKFDAHPEGWPAITMGRKEYARFCVPADPKYVSLGEQRVRAFARSAR
jgi:hypothetical protein